MSSTELEPNHSISISYNIKSNNRMKSTITSFLLVQVTLLILCIILAAFFQPILMLTENQILYFFSTSSQVIAGMYGLTMTGYIFLNDRLNNAVIEDETLYDTVEDLKKEYYSLILLMGIFCALALIFSFINIFYLDSINKVIYSFFLNQGTVFIISEIMLIIYFTLRVIDPEKITKVSSVLKKRNEYEHSSTGDLSDFLKHYNMLEKLIIETAFSKFNIVKEKKYKPSIMYALKLLHSENIITQDLHHKINELRKYRNFVVHGNDPKVSTKACNDIRNVYNEVERILTQ